MKSSKAKHKEIPIPTYKPALRRVPAQKLSEIGGFGLEAAKYHLEQIEKDMKSPGIATCWDKKLVSPEEGTRLQEDVNRFHRHLRAFFWELIAEFDMLLAYVNEIEALGVPEASVSWSTLASAALNLGKWPDTLKRLADVYCSKWFTEVRYYRNFAHRSSLFLQCAYDGSLSLTHAWLLPSIEGESPNYDLRQQLSEYFHHMEKFLRP